MMYKAEERTGKMLQENEQLIVCVWGVITKWVDGQTHFAFVYRDQNRVRIYGSILMITWVRIWVNQNGVRIWVSNMSSHLVNWVRDAKSSHPWFASMFQSRAKNLTMRSISLVSELGKKTEVSKRVPAVS